MIILSAGFPKTRSSDMLYVREHFVPFYVYLKSQVLHFLIASFLT